MSKHTPWRVSEHCLDGKVSTQVVGNLDELIAEIHTTDFSHLIAAAPEMYAALVDFKTAYASGSPACMAAAFVAARDAISKAEGTLQT